MKTNGNGMPTEGVGASRGAQGSWKGGPKWGKAKFWFVFLRLTQLANRVPPCSLVYVEIKLWYS